MKLLVMVVLFLVIGYAQESKEFNKLANSVTDKEIDNSKELSTEESQIASDYMLEIQNLQLTLQRIDQQLAQKRSIYTEYEQGLSVKYGKVGCTLSLKRAWLCPSEEGKEE